MNGALNVRLDGFLCGRLLQDHMGIGAPNAVGTHLGPTGVVTPLPFRQCPIDIERAVSEINLWVGHFEIQAGREQLMLEHQDCFYQACDTGGRNRMSYICFYGTDGAEALRRSVGAKHLCQRSNFNGIAQGCSGPVCLDIGDGFRLNPGYGQRLGHDLCLAILTGRRVASFRGRAIVVDGRTSNDRMNAISVGQGVIQPLQHHHPHTAAEQGPRSLGIKGSGVPVRRKNHPLGIRIAGLLWHSHGHAASQCDITSTNTQ